MTVQSPPVPIVGLLRERGILLPWMKNQTPTILGIRGRSLDTGIQGRSWDKRTQEEGLDTGFKSRKLDTGNQGKNLDTGIKGRNLDTVIQGINNKVFGKQTPRFLEILGKKRRDIAYYTGLPNEIQ